MEDLARVVESLRGSHIREPDTVGVRHGWATEQVIAALREADGPLSIAALREAVAERSGSTIKHSTVHYILRHGRWAKSGQIEAEATGQYRLS